MKMIARVSGFVAIMAVVVMGCATTSGPTDEELIQMTMEKMKTALETQDMEMLMETFSEDFEHPEVGGKEEARAMLQMGMDAGYADDGEVYLEDMEIEFLEDGEAVVYPVDLAGAPGAISVEITLGKTDGQWLITYVDAQGI